MDFFTHFCLELFNLLSKMNYSLPVLGIAELELIYF